MHLDPQVKERLKKTFNDELAIQKKLVTIISVYHLTQDELQKIMTQFPRYAMSYIENKIDPSLLGGFIIQCGSENIDLSIRNALHLLKKQLYESN